jgi:hypothetical protein
MVFYIFLLALGYKHPFANILFRYEMAATKLAGLSIKISVITRDFKEFSLAVLFHETFWTKTIQYFKYVNQGT